MTGFFVTIARAAVLIACLAMAACASSGSYRDNAQMGQQSAQGQSQYGYTDQYYGGQTYGTSQYGMAETGTAQDRAYYGQMRGGADASLSAHAGQDMTGQAPAGQTYGQAQYSMQDYQAAYEEAYPQQQMSTPTRQRGDSQLLDASPEYVIGPMDELNIFVWRAPELSGDVTVRPDGRISTPLVQDMQAAGKTPTELAEDVRVQLTEFVRQPQVTVRVKQFSSTFSQQVRVLGEAQRPVALPYQAGMTVLDVMVAVGGLTEFAAGNRAVLIRGQGDARETYRLRLDDLMRRAEVKANVPVLPGDVILIPESIF